MKIKFLIIASLLFSNYHIYSKHKEVAFNATSSFVVQNDSFFSNYLKAKELYENNEYSESLRLSLSLVDDNNKLESKEIILINHLIANIFFATRSNLNAIKYYKKTLNYLGDYLDKDIEDNNISDELFLGKNKILAESLLSLGSSYYRLHNTENIKKYQDSSLYYYNEVDKLNSFDKDIFQVKSRAYINLSAIYMNDSLYNKAKFFGTNVIFKNTIRRTDHYRYWSARFNTLGLRVKGFTKLHDINAVLTQGWTNWRTGVCFTCSNLQFNICFYFLSHYRLL